MDKTLMEIWFDHFLVFPYKYLDWLSQDQWSDFSESAIYFVLQSDRKRILDYEYKNGGLQIVYRNMKTQQQYTIGPFPFFNFDIPDQFVQIKIHSGILVEIGLNSAGINYFQNCDPGILNEYNLSTPFKITLFDLIAHYEQQFGTVNQYPLLYIGQSIKMRERFLRHETVHKIIRDLEISDPDTEVLITMYHPTSKFYSEHVFKNLNSTAILGNSQWKEYSFLSGTIGDAELLDATEAILIQFFNPRYNVIYKNTLPNNAQKTYTKLEENHIQKLQVNLDLRTHRGDTIHLTTDTASTNASKAIILSCDLSVLDRDKQCEIHVRELSDWEYAILNS